MSNFSRYPKGIYLVLLLVFVACNEKQDKENYIVTTSELAEWENRLHVKFPKNTKILGYKMETGRDDSAYIKLAIPKDNWKKFLSDSLVNPKDLDNQKRFFLSQDKDWWDPSKPKALPTAQAELPNGSIINMGVDLSSTTNTIIYIMWHER